MDNTSTATDMQQSNEGGDRARIASMTAGPRPTGRAGEPGPGHTQQRGTDVTDHLGITGHILDDVQKQGRGALIGYLPLGYPTLDDSIQAMEAIATGRDGLGCDLVEIGLPYSDPMMDGPTIQHAGQIALERGTKTADVFSAAEAVAKTGKRAVVMTYWNLIEQYGVDAFARDLANAGGAGCITPDLIPDEADEWITASDAYGLDRIFLISPVSSDDRIAYVTSSCRGWVYATAVMGVTGVRAQSSTSAPTLVARARQIDPILPVGVGLGISNREQARDVVKYASAAIVGSALVQKLIDQDGSGSIDLDPLRDLAQSLALGVRDR